MNFAISLLTLIDTSVMKSLPVKKRVTAKNNSSIAYKEVQT